ncbi:hypothetical protein EKJ_26430 [Qipengyuania flava]|uniref:ATP-binding protein n=1 Tax=Qipengyuania flava TaxID=192812 RepID=A0A3T1CLC7_9SPHN|nr:ATP-binding protein [Qipengyuania flava]BBI21796.1 hypothetical protein EKJ_26430 [Qipengyuania flava]
MARIGYSLEEAVSDLVDNSIDAKADSILIRFVRNEKIVTGLMVADDGHGMSRDELLAAMKFGSENLHDREDLGKFGMGMKLASISQCSAMTAITRQGGKVHAMRWTNSSIDSDWHCEEIDPAEVDQVLSSDWLGMDVDDCGTVIVWEDLYDFSRLPGEPDKAISDASSRLSEHLGLVFHRFLERGLNLKIGAVVQVTGDTGIETPVVALNPFSYKATGSPGYPKEFIVNLSDIGSLTMKAHIWPAKSRDPGFRLGKGKVAERQGFYFYRNDRLIQAGGWNWVLNAQAEPHMSLARVQVDLPPEYDHAFSVNVQKSQIDVPRTFPDEVRKSESGEKKFTQYLADAQSAYRDAGGKETDFPLVIGSGVPPAVRSKSRKAFKDESGSYREVEFTWAKLPKSLFFKVDPERQRILLNKEYRRAVLNGKRASANDAPLVKALLFLLASGDIDKKRITKGHQQWLDACNQILLSAVGDADQ